jgi:hypothetical protein
MQVAHALSLRQRRPRSLPVPPFRSSSGMELFEAAIAQDWEKVMVRRAAHWRPFPAPSLVRREPSAWGSASGPIDAVVAHQIRPSCVESSPYVRHQEWSCSRRPLGKIGRRSWCAAHWRPFLASSMVHREPSARDSASGPIDAVVAHQIRPCCAESSPYVRHQSGNCDAACRRSFVPVTTSSSVTRTLPCRLAESHHSSLPPSPAIAVPATF